MGLGHACRMNGHRRHQSVLCSAQLLAMAPGGDFEAAESQPPGDQRPVDGLDQAAAVLGEDRVGTVVAQDDCGIRQPQGSRDRLGGASQCLGRVEAGVHLLADGPHDGEGVIRPAEEPAMCGVQQSSPQRREQHDQEREVPTGRASTPVKAKLLASRS